MVVAQAQAQETVVAAQKVVVPMVVAQAQAQETVVAAQKVVVPMVVAVEMEEAVMTLLR